MSTEYAVKMELLRRNREELTAKRLEIERRIALREATAAEYSAVALQSCKQQWKTLRANAISAKKKNDEFIREVHDTQRKIDETYVRTTQKLWPSDNQLELEKARYLRNVEELYPAWQEKMQAMRVQTLRELEAKKRAIEQRRFLAKKTFETEQTLEDLIRRTTHEIELAENLEKNEAFERDVLRNQGEIQAMRIDESIRDHALGARMYMKQQAENQLDEAQHLQSDVEEKIFETFSPRGAVNAMKQSNRSVNLVDTSNNNAEERHVRPLRAQNILVPEPQYRYEELDSKQQQMEPFAKMKPALKNSAPVETPINDAYAWARSDLRSRERLNTVQPTLTSTHDNFDSASLAITASPIHPHESDPLSRQDEALNKRAPNLTPSFSGTMWPLDRGIAVRDGQGQITSAPFESYQPPTQLLPSSLSHQMEQSTRTQDIPTPLDSKHQCSTLVAEAMVSKTFDRPHQDHSQIQSQMDSIKNDHQDFQLRPQTTANGPDPPNDLQHEPMEDAKYVFNLSQPCQDEYKDETKASLTENRPEPNRSDSDIANSDIVAEVKVLQFKELPAQEKIIEPIAEDDLPESIEAVLINSSSPPPHEEEEEAKNDSAPYHDLTLDFNSFDSNQSSMMDFSIGKLLESSVKADTLDGSTPILFCQEDTTATGLSEGPTQPSSGLETADQVVVPPDPSFVHDADHVTIQGVKEATHTQFTHLARDKSIEFSSVDSLSGLDSQGLEVEGVLESLRGTECPTLENPSENQTIPLVEDLEVTIESPPLSPEDGARETSIFAMLTMADRLKALNALISRVEEGINDGDQISCGMESGSSQETTRELLRMAVSGRKAQINFFGTDVCFELIAQLAKDLGPVLFPAKAFEGIMNDQKMKKVHHNAKEKEFDMWKAFAAHIKQVHAARAVPAGALVDMFTNAFLSHDPNNQRSQRKLREYLLSVCGATEATPKKDLTPSPPRQTTSPPIEPSSLANSTEVPSSPQMPSLLQTAFLQQSSPAKPKVYGIASSGFKKKLASDDVLKSMASSPTKLSQKLIRGGKMGDYSEFEEEEEVNLENLIGSKASSASTASKAASAFRSGGGNSMARMGTAKEDRGDFDFDF